VSWLPPKRESEVESYTVFWCHSENNRDRPYQVNNYLLWKLLLFIYYSINHLPLLLFSLFIVWWSSSMGGSTCICPHAQCHSQQKWSVSVCRGCQHAYRILRNGMGHLHHITQQSCWQAEDRLHWCLWPGCSENQLALRLFGQSGYCDWLQGIILWVGIPVWHFWVHWIWEI